MVDCANLCKWRAIDEADLESFWEKQENANKNNKTSYNLKLFKEFLASEEEIRKLKKFLPPSCKNLRLCSVLERKMVARFPHRSLLHYAYTPLFQENNSDHNRRPLGLWRFVLSF